MSDSAPPVCLLVHLAGSLRGKPIQVSGEELKIGTGPDVEVQLPYDLEPRSAPHHATLYRRGGTYEIRAVPGNHVWVNAEAVERLVLASGDVIELGRDGAVLRFRTYPPGARPSRTVGELFSDCMECATRGADSLPGRAGIAVRQLPRDLIMRSSLTVRAVLALLTVAAATSIWMLVGRTQDLETRLATLTTGVEVAGLLERSEAAGVDTASLTELLQPLAAGIASTERRLDSLQERIERPSHLIRRASRATLFIQGSFGFRDPKSGLDLKLVLGLDGRPLRDALGEPVLRLGGDGPPLESQYTGTGWVASGDGLVVTNRHVALPWEFDPSAKILIQRGLEPVMRRFVGFLPGKRTPFDVTLVAASDDGDVAVLRCSVGAEVPFLEMASADSAEPGDDVIVLGYPLGIRALMARAGPAFVEEVQRAGDLDFWNIAKRLGERGLIAPLATRGIVGQRTADYVTYDAETTHGGSGGPVIDTDGRVIAINAAILPEFGGSNLGVPADLAADLLKQIAATGVKRDP